MATSKRNTDPAFMSLKSNRKGKRAIDADQAEVDSVAANNENTSIVEPDAVSNVSDSTVGENPTLHEEDGVMAVIASVKKMSGMAQNETNELKHVIADVDLTTVPPHALIELALRFCEAAEYQQREQYEQQRRVAARIGKLMAGFGGAPKGFGFHPETPRPSRIARFIYRNPENPDQVWGGMGPKPDWLKALEAANADLSKVREPNPALQQA